MAVKAKFKKGEKTGNSPRTDEYYTLGEFIESDSANWGVTSDGNTTVGEIIEGDVLGTKDGLDANENFVCKIKPGRLYAGVFIEGRVEQ